MTGHVAGQQPPGSTPFTGLRVAARDISGYWWMELLAGIAWVVVSLVILQFDSASITTVGVLLGFMFTASAVQNFAVAAALSGGARWAAAIFGGMFIVAAVVCFASPQNTFVAMADSLGFLFLIVGIWWMTRAFLERAVNPYWWLTLISGVLMSIMAFWTSGQFFIHRAYVLLVFAGIWALMQGITDMVRAFSVRRLHEEL